MNVAVVGLGLIGGSLAKSIKEKTNYKVFGWDNSEEVRNNAVSSNSIDEIIIDGNPESCDIVLVALYPKITLEYLEKFKKNFKKDAMVIDCAGVKEKISLKGTEVANENGFVFCGGHPMAGLEKSGFNFSSSSLFNGATMILTPTYNMEDNIIKKIEDFIISIGFGEIRIATPKEHDKMIAYTSQLAHVVSSAYIKSSLSSKFKGFSAGSFHDMTRVAKLNEDMWTELFFENSDYLADEIDDLISRLEKFSMSIRNGEEELLKAMLKEGKELRLSVDKEKDIK